MEHPLSKYATDEMVDLWSPERNVAFERDWWIEIVSWLYDHTRVYEHIHDAGNKLHCYRAAAGSIDLEAIEQREYTTKHDVKARIEEFNYLATQEYRKARPDYAQTLELIHWGLTSADVVDNVSLIKMSRSLNHLWRLTSKDDGPAGPLIDALHALPLRGLKGAVGTQQDLNDLFLSAGHLSSYGLLQELDYYLSTRFGFNGRYMNATGQVYPRSLDYMVVSQLQVAVSLASAPRPWPTILNGYAAMIAGYSDDQWNEGDISSSAIRRVALPGAFLAAECGLRKVQP
jgi:adenylosuccinate lyase